MGTPNRPASRPDRQLARSKRDRYLDTGAASRELDGLISAGILRQMALNGEIKGAIKVRHRVLIPKWVVPSLVQELDYAGTPQRLPRPQANSFDAPTRWASG